MQFGDSSSRAIDDVADHFDACHLLEARRLAPDDLQRRDTDPLEIRNRAQATGSVWQTLKCHATAVAVHIPDPFTIIGQVASQPVLTAGRETAAGPFEFRLHFGQARAKRADGMM